MLELFLSTMYPLSLLSMDLLLKVLKELFWPLTEADSELLILLKSEALFAKLFLDLNPKLFSSLLPEITELPKASNYSN